MNIAIIPARIGSKRIPRKNIKEFCGQPMIIYAINAAKSSKLFEHIIVSTDDDEIAKIAISAGAEVPFIRPSELADDHTETNQVIVHAINSCKNLGWIFDNVCCIYPSVPFIEINDLKKTLECMNNSEINYCFPVAKYSSPIQRALKFLDNKKTVSFYPEFELTRTQDLEASYFDAGQFYWGTTEAWLKNPRIHNNAAGYILPTWRAIDIDNPDDWERAEFIYHSIHHDLFKDKKI